ncbi:hypothetical protein OAN22_00455 [Alphaproteobacteria bacterium]|nr:hypothetical protein [Alphaproteobacteria bacterium]
MRGPPQWVIIIGGAVLTCLLIWVWFQFSESTPSVVTSQESVTGVFSGAEEDEFAEEESLIASVSPRQSTIPAEIAQKGVSRPIVAKISEVKKGSPDTSKPAVAEMPLEKASGETAPASSSPAVEN